MHFSYNKLFKLMIDRNIKKKELSEMSDVSATSIAKLGKGGNVNTGVLLRICNALNCDVGDIMEFVPDKKQESVADDGKTSATSHEFDEELADAFQARARREVRGCGPVGEQIFLPPADRQTGLAPQIALYLGAGQGAEHLDF